MHSHLVQNHINPRETQTHAERARPASARAMIARGPKTEDESCAIRMTPSKTPVLFGGGRTMTEAEVFKTWMGHIKVQCAMAPQLSVLPPPHCAVSRPLERSRPTVSS